MTARSTTEVRNDSVDPLKRLTLIRAVPAAIASSRNIRLEARLGWNAIVYNTAANPAIPKSTMVQRAARGRLLKSEFVFIVSSLSFFGLLARRIIAGISPDDRVCEKRIPDDRLCRDGRFCSQNVRLPDDRLAPANSVTPDNGVTPYDRIAPYDGVTPGDRVIPDDRASPHRL